MSTKLTRKINFQILEEIPSKTIDNVPKMQLLHILLTI